MSCASAAPQDMFLRTLISRILTKQLLLPGASSLPAFVSSAFQRHGRRNLEPQCASPLGQDLLELGPPPVADVMADDVQSESTWQRHNLVLVKKLHDCDLVSMQQHSPTPEFF